MFQFQKPQLPCRRICLNDMIISPSVKFSYEILYSKVLPATGFTCIVFPMLNEAIREVDLPSVSVPKVLRRKLACGNRSDQVLPALIPLGKSAGLIG